jgi:hypothetical protein
MNSVACFDPLAVMLAFRNMQSNAVTIQPIVRGSAVGFQWLEQFSRFARSRLRLAGSGQGGDGKVIAL